MGEPSAPQPRPKITNRPVRCKRIIRRSATFSRGTPNFRKGGPSDEDAWCWTLAQRRRRSGPQPRVAATRLPWGNVRSRGDNPNGVVAVLARTDRVRTRKGERLRHNPDGVAGVRRLPTQGSAFGATLGWQAQPLWGSAYRGRAGTTLGLRPWARWGLTRVVRL